MQGWTNFKLFCLKSQVYTFTEKHCVSPHVVFFYNNITHFLTFKNSLHNSINISYKTQVDNKVSPSFEFFRKPTCTDNVIPYSVQSVTLFFSDFLTYFFL